MTSPLKDKIQGGCPVCGGDGYVGDELCNCAIKFRVYNRLTSGGFNEQILDFVSSSSYVLPLIEGGMEAVEYFYGHPFEVMRKGLGLFITSKENGRGKTTLAHYLTYVLAWPFAKTENYDRRRTYAFENIHTMCEQDRSWEDYDSWRSTVLVIDDLGTESRNSQWKREGVTAMLHRIMHYRRDHQLPTIITSNFNAVSLSSFYNGVLDSVLEIRPDGVIGGQLLRQVDVGGAEDFRLTDGQSEWPL